MDTQLGVADIHGAALAFLNDEINSGGLDVQVWCCRQLQTRHARKRLTMRAIQSVTFSYVARQDRLLAAINPGRSEAWSCWLTRRIVQVLLERLREFLETTSPSVKQVPSAVRGEVLAFEHEAAMAATARAMSRTSSEVISESASVAELIERLTISNHADLVHIEIHGETGNGAIGVFGRAELQRLLQMLQAEATQANWFGVSEKPSEVGAVGPKPVSH